MEHARAFGAVERVQWPPPLVGRVCGSRVALGRRTRRWRLSLGDMADEAADDLETVPGLIAIAFYIIGAAIVGFGLLKLKRHVDHPQQTTIGSGLIAILIGVALIAAPAVINALGATFGVDGRQPHRPQAEAVGQAEPQETLASCPSPSPQPPTTCSA